MSRTTLAEDHHREFAEAGLSSGSEPRGFLAASLRNHSLAGLAGGFMLCLIEWIDLNVLLTPELESFSERLTFTTYFSLDLLVAAVLGLIVGLFVHATIFLKCLLQRVLAGKGNLRRLHSRAAAVAVFALAGAFLYLQSGVFGFTLGAIREAEKIALARLLLKAELLFTYLVIIGLLVSCWTIWTIARATESMNERLRVVWMFALALLIAAAYYVDSRVEVLQYEFSLHRGMFLLEFTLAMALATSLQFSLRDGLRARIARGVRYNRILPVTLTIVLVSAVAFTFANFDSNQNLKALVFSRSTQTKQYFKLAQWALDLDRDGYSAVLGGGDAADSQPRINPGCSEIVGDGIDNNCIGGELSQGALDEWMRGNTEYNTSPNPGAKQFNVIFIFIDAVRADHLSAYGYGRNTSPNLAKLAERASIFDNAFTPSPSTYQAVPKFMQSSYWDAHLPTWTELLAHNGYDTVLFPGRRAKTLYRRIKDPQMISSARTSNLKQSVDAVIEKFSTRTERPLCAYLYGFEPHMPYKLRSDFYFGPSLADLYDGELAYADHQLGRLFDWLDQSGTINDTIIVVMSDHGESLGERSVYKHNAQLYNEQMRVPIIIHVPGFAPRRMTDYVSTIDLGSTILNAVGIPCPKEYTGVSLLPLMRGESFTRPPIYGEHWQRNDSPFFGPEHNVDPEIRKYMVITQDGFKLIYTRNAYSFELFNLNEDPKEQHNLFDRMPDRAAELKRLLGRFVDVVLVSRPPDADEQRFFRDSHDEDSHDDE